MRWPTLCFLLAACATPDQAPVTPPPSSAPRDMLFEVAVDHTATRLRAIHDALPQSSLRAQIPIEPGDWLDAIATLPPDVSARIDPDAPVRMIALAHRLGDEPQTLAAATRVARLEGLITTADPELHYARWVGDRRDGPVLALSGDVLVAAEDRATLAIALPYLATNALAEPVARGLRVRGAPSALPRARTALEGWIEHSASQAIEAARAERGAHEGAPALGEPESLVAVLRDAALEWTAYLPDVTRVELTLSASDHGISAIVEMQVQGDTPLARAIAGAEAIDGRALFTLPRGVALAWRDAGHTRATERIQTLQRVAGDRMSAAEASSIEAAISAWGAPSTLLLGTIDTTPFAAAIGSSSTEVDSATLVSAATGPYARGALAMVLGCHEPATDPGVICREPPSSVELAQDHGQRALVLRRGVDSIAAQLLRATDPLGDAPDFARDRSLFAEPDLLAAGLWVPSRTWRSASLLGHPALARLASAPSRLERDAPIVAIVRRSSSGAHIELRANGAALADLLAAASPLFDLN